MMRRRGEGSTILICYCPEQQLNADRGVIYSQFSEVHLQTVFLRRSVLDTALSKTGSENELGECRYLIKQLLLQV